MRVFYNKAIFGKEEIDAIKKVLEGFMIVGGDNTKEFEKKIARMFGKKYGVMVSSGSSANLIAFELLNLPMGSEVITPIVTFGTTISPIYQKGLVPAYVDVKPDTYQINVGQVKEMITKKTKALMVPSLFGNIPDLPALAKIAKKYNLFLIEDSCDTLGARLNGKPTGVYSDISTTSFFAPHVITTGGHGGMICINRGDWADSARVLIGWGRSSARGEIGRTSFKDVSESISARFDIDLDGIPYDRKFVFETLGYNFLPSEIDAAFGLAQLKKFNKFKTIRKKNFAKLLVFIKRYEEFFVLPKQNLHADTCWLAFPLIVKDEAPFSRRDLVIYLEENGIQTRPVFTGNALRHSAFKNLKAKKRKGGYPIADLIMRGSFVIGCHHGMDDAQVTYVKEKFEEFIKDRTKS